MEPGEAPAVAAGLVMFFLLFAGYFMLRPVRETMGVASGSETLQWLFTGTFVATVAVLPVFGWVASKVFRREPAWPPPLPLSPTISGWDASNRRSKHKPNPVELYERRLR